MSNVHSAIWKSFLFFLWMATNFILYFSAAVDAKALIFITPFKPCLIVLLRHWTAQLLDGGEMLIHEGVLHGSNAFSMLTVSLSSHFTLKTLRSQTVPVINPLFFLSYSPEHVLWTMQCLCCIDFFFFKCCKSS